MSGHQHGYPWSSLATRLYRSLLPEGLKDYIIYRHSAVDLPLLVHVSSFLLRHPCPTCLVCLTWIVFVMGGKRPYGYCFVGCCLQDLFKIARSILVWLPSSFFSIHLVSVYVVHLYSSIDTTAAWKKLHFILSVRSDFHMTDSFSIAVHAFASRVLMSVSVDDTLLPW